MELESSLTDYLSSNNEQCNSNNNNRRLTKNEKRRLKKKNKLEPNNHSQVTDLHVYNNISEIKNNKNELDIEIEYVSADFENQDNLAPEIFEQFKNIFEKFAKAEELLNNANDKDKLLDLDNSEETNKGFEESKNDNQLIESNQKLSKRKKKLLSRLSVAELKQLVQRPDVVEAHDISSTDPRLLVYLKSFRNSVPVPRHWCNIRKYLQGKRGIEKPPFQLPDFIAETGIAKIRDAIMEQEQNKKGKQKARERIRPKMGKIDIDYQVLHDAFFKYQTKPSMTNHGDLYFEGKEFEVKFVEKTPGRLSSELSTALGMQDGFPPPWLINMQRYGPPPSYAHLRIPGLNAPLPPGAVYGYQPGGWGKPPVDEYGRPLYGDVFGIAATTDINPAEQVDKEYRFGAHLVEDVSEEEDEEEEEEEEEDQQQTGPNSTFDSSGLETPSSFYDGTASLVAGIETPAIIDLRKRAGQETPDISVSRELYQVIKENKASASSNGQLFGSDRTYVFNNKNDVQISINPDELEDMITNKEKIQELHDAQATQKARDLLYQSSRSNYGNSGMETEEDRLKGSKKRKAENTPVVSKKIKDFKF